MPLNRLIGGIDMETASVTRVRAENQERWAQLALSLVDPFNGGKLLLYPEDFSCRIRGADDLSAGYGLRNWESGVMSGALYAFRFLKQPRRRILVSEMEGYLRGEDMPALAMASTVAVIELMNGDHSALQIPGWQCRVNL
jgi:hypothetical protein